MLKKLLLAAVLLTVLFSFSLVFADQDGRKCWCNIDEYGCWITGDDGGKIYIMFWSEQSRQFIMGSYSAPYKYVVAHPGYFGTLPLQCGAISVSDSNSGDDPVPADTCQQELANCNDLCDRADCSNQMANCIDKDSCKLTCQSNYKACIGNAD